MTRCPICFRATCKTLILPVLQLGASEAFCNPRNRFNGLQGEQEFWFRFDDYHGVTG